MLYVPYVIRPLCYTPWRIRCPASHHDPWNRASKDIHRGVLGRKGRNHCLRKWVAINRISFCYFFTSVPFLPPYWPPGTFSQTAEISYFISPKHTGKGIGTAMLLYLVTQARQSGLTSILASVSSLNEDSIRFHSKNGFVECGRFCQVGTKKGQVFDVVYMQRMI